MVNFRSSPFSGGGRSIVGPSSPSPNYSKPSGGGPPPGSLSAQPANVGGAPRPSSIGGSVSVGPSPAQATLQARQAALGSATATQQLGAPASVIPYRTIGGETQTLSELPPQFYVGASPAFAGKASTVPGVNVQTVPGSSLGFTEEEKLRPRFGNNVMLSLGPRVRARPELQEALETGKATTYTNLLQGGINAGDVFESGKERTQVQIGQDIFDLGSPEYNKRVAQIGIERGFGTSNPFLPGLQTINIEGKKFGGFGTFEQIASESPKVKAIGDVLEALQLRRISPAKQFVGKELLAENYANTQLLKSNLELAKNPYQQYTEYQTRTQDKEGSSQIVFKGQSPTFTVADVLGGSVSKNTVFDFKNAPFLTNVKIGYQERINIPFSEKGQELVAGALVATPLGLLGEGLPLTAATGLPYEIFGTPLNVANVAGAGLGTEEIASKIFSGYKEIKGGANPTQVFVGESPKIAGIAALSYGPFVQGGFFKPREFTESLTSTTARSTPSQLSTTESVFGKVSKFESEPVTIAPGVSKLRGVQTSEVAVRYVAQPKNIFGIDIGDPVSSTQTFRLTSPIKGFSSESKTGLLGEIYAQRTAPDYSRLTRGPTSLAPDYTDLVPTKVLRTQKVATYGPEGLQLSNEVRDVGLSVPKVKPTEPIASYPKLTEVGRPFKVGQRAVSVERGQGESFTLLSEDVIRKPSYNRYQRLQLIPERRVSVPTVGTESRVKSFGIGSSVEDLRILSTARFSLGENPFLVYRQKPFFTVKELGQVRNVPETPLISSGFEMSTFVSEVSKGQKTTNVFAGAELTFETEGGKGVLGIEQLPRGKISRLRAATTRVKQTLEPLTPKSLFESLTRTGKLRTLRFPALETDIVKSRSQTEGSATSFTGGFEENRLRLFSEKMQRTQIDQAGAFTLGGETAKVVGEQFFPGKFELGRAPKVSGFVFGFIPEVSRAINNRGIIPQPPIQRFTPETIPATKPVQRFVPDVIQETNLVPDLKVDIRQEQRFVPDNGFPGPIPNGGGPGTPPPPIVPGPPPFKFPKFGGGLSLPDEGVFSERRGRASPKQYTPSVFAGLFGVTAKGIPRGESAFGIVRPFVAPRQRKRSALMFSKAQVSNRNLFKAFKRR